MEATTAPPTGPAAEEEPRFMRSAIIGAVLGFVATTIGIAAVTVTAGHQPLVASLGLGAFAGIWSGIGFGFMMGATIPLGRRLDHR
ncbi:MAG TPA: hypothetical protein VK007_03600 [Acidimicrobiales bacterium]|nr:hypothetical protein [Acidimicrobiales bacterium]